MNKLTANLLAGHTSLKLSCIEDRTKDKSFDMTGDIEEKRQSIRDYTKQHNIRILNRLSFNWPL